MRSLWKVLREAVNYVGTAFLVMVVVIAVLALFALLVTG